MMATINLCSAAVYIETYRVSIAAAEKLFSVLEQNTNIDTLTQKSLKPSDFGGSIEFKNVSFAYPSRSKIKVSSDYYNEVNNNITNFHLNYLSIQLHLLSGLK